MKEIQKEQYLLPECMVLEIRVRRVIATSMVGSASAESSAWEGDGEVWAGE